MQTIEEGTAKRLLLMAMYLVITLGAIFGWGSITSGPGYMQVRIIITIVAAITFYLLFAGDVMQILNKLFAQDVERNKQISSGNQDTALPPPRNPAVQLLGSHRINTAEMVQPPSVTEHTTNLLDKNKR